MEKEQPSTDDKTTEKVVAPKATSKKAGKLGIKNVVETYKPSPSGAERWQAKKAEQKALQNARKPEKDAQSDEIGNVEALTPTETAAAYGKLAEGQRKSAEAEVQTYPKDSPEAAAAEAAIAFNSEIEADPDHDPVEAARKTLIEFGGKTPEEADEVLESMPEVLPEDQQIEGIESDEEPESEPSEAAEEDEDPEEASPEESTPAPGEDAAEEDEDDPTTITIPHPVPTPIPVPIVPTPPTPTPPGGGSSSGGGPPLYPLPSPGPGSAPIPSGGFYAPPLAPAAGPNMITMEESRYYERRALSGGLLVGGIVGYLLGRRKGRIKTEKRLLPVQRKLEKKVKSLQTELVDKEWLVRQAASERIRAEAAAGHTRGASEKLPLAVAAASGRLNSERQQSEAAALPVFGTKLERQQQAAAAAKVEESPSLSLRRNEMRKVAPEANQVHGKQLPLEHIGQVLIAGEALRPRQSRAEEEAYSKSPRRATSEISFAERIEQPTAEQVRAIENHTETMDRTELLALSEKISIDGANLRDVYETHLVGEKGLRRIVTEYLRGGDVKRVLRRELVEREIDFERDPQLRDRARASISGSGKSALNALLQQTGALPERNEAEMTPFEESKAKYEESVAAKKQNNRKLADITLVVTIVVLIAAIIILLGTKT